MLIHLNTTDDRAIYAQIADQVKFAVAAGLLRPGELVDSVRELSKRLVVNPNTVARAYRDLQAEGVLEPIRGTGLQVTEGAAAICRDNRLEFVRRTLRGAIDEARRSNLGHAEIEAILREEWSRDGQGSNSTNGTGPDERSATTTGGDR